MSSKENIKAIWREVFNPTNEWLEMYFGNVYRDEDLMTLTAGDDDDVIASALLLQQYKMQFHGVDVPVAYVSGAVTRRQYRGRGYMKELMNSALREAYDRGDVMMTLIPADRHLYFYYDKFGFSTVFYIDEERYTELHTFPVIGDYADVTPADSDEVYRAVDAMTRRRDNVMVHSRQDFSNILLDNSLDGGQAIVLRDNATGEIAAFALAVVVDNRVMVKELLYTNPDARDAALRRVTQHFPGKPLTILAPPDSRHIPIRAQGMGRIINVGKLLSGYAARYPKIKLAVRVYDSLLPVNNHIYVVDRGEVVVNDGFGGRLDLDVTQEVLLSILCSDPSMGDIFNLPTGRPYMSMMMD